MMRCSVAIYVFGMADLLNYSGLLWTQIEGVQIIDESQMTQ